jgi:hypothetical protein
VVDGWMLSFSAVSVASLLLLGRGALAADGDVPGLRRRHGAVATMAGFALVARVCLARSRESYIRWRDPSMAAQRALRAACLLVRPRPASERRRGGSTRGIPAMAAPRPPPPHRVGGPPHAWRHARPRLSHPRAQAFISTLTPAAWLDVVTKKMAANAPAALTATIFALYSFWVRTARAI